MKEGIVKFGDALYPKPLCSIPNPPEQLYYRGDITLANNTAVALVGSRKATEYGGYVARKMAGRLAENGIVVVSGMASGIDTFAHLGVLDAKGKTIAVLGNGVDICYPRGSESLKRRIEEEGLVLSEYPNGTKPTHYTFPQRNRIISGLSEATCVVEAGLNSGSLITAEFAVEQGRMVYAVPGNITGIMSIGCNRLLQDGAIPVAVIDDIVCDLASRGLCTKREGPSYIMKKLGEDEQKIYDYILNNGETTLEKLSLALKKSPKELAAIVTILEMKGLLQGCFGKIFIAN